MIWMILTWDKTRKEAAALRHPIRPMIHLAQISATNFDEHGEDDDGEDDDDDDDEDHPTHPKIHLVWMTVTNYDDDDDDGDENENDHLHWSPAPPSLDDAPEKCSLTHSTSPIWSLWSNWWSWCDGGGDYDGDDDDDFGYYGGDDGGDYDGDDDSGDYDGDDGGDYDGDDGGDVDDGNLPFFNPSASLSSPGLNISCSVEID